MEAEEKTRIDSGGKEKRVFVRNNNDRPDTKILK